MTVGKAMAAAILERKSIVGESTSLGGNMTEHNAGLEPVPGIISEVQLVVCIHILFQCIKLPRESF